MTYEKLYKELKVFKANIRNELDRLFDNFDARLNGFEDFEDISKEELKQKCIEKFKLYEQKRGKQEDVISK